MWARGQLESLHLGILGWNSPLVCSLLASHSHDSARRRPCSLLSLNTEHVHTPGCANSTIKIHLLCQEKPVTVIFNHYNTLRSYAVFSFHFLSVSNLSEIPVEVQQSRLALLGNGYLSICLVDVFYLRLGDCYVLQEKCQSDGRYQWYCEE